MSLDAQEAELLCLICQDGMWCMSLPQDAWNLSGGCQTTQDAQDAGDAEDAGEATRDAQDAGDADSMSRVSGRNGAVSDAG